MRPFHFDSDNCQGILITIGNLRKREKKKIFLLGLLSPIMLNTLDNIGSPVSMELHNGIIVLPTSVC